VRAWGKAVRAGRAAIAAIVIVAASAGGWASYLQLTGNVHVVEDGAVYRSATLWPHQLKAVLGEKRIRTVLNLRGSNPGTDWYATEKATTSEDGIRLVDFRMSAYRELPDKQIAELVSLLRTVEKPLLIHCQAGADRTGLAAALYELAVAGKPADEAAEQLSFFYGHFPWAWSRSGAMDRTFWRATKLLQALPASALP
jgi:protein tyrosine/serine phosphatase